MVFTIPIDFCIKFWDSTFPLVLEFTEEIFYPLWRELSNGAANPRCISASILKFSCFSCCQLNLDILY